MKIKSNYKHRSMHVDRELTKTSLRIKKKFRVREDWSGSLWHENRRWIKVFINSHLLQTKIDLPREKALREILWVDCNPLIPLPHPNIHRGKWENKAKQNKIKIIRYLTETKLWRNAIISLKLIDLRTGQIELKNFFFDTEIIIQ